MKNLDSSNKSTPLISLMSKVEEVEKEVAEKKWNKKDAARALQTYFRNNYRTHISLSALADRKSHIMIRLNSLLISILIVFFKGIISLTPAAIITGVIFLLTTLISLIFAAIAARPSVTKRVSAETSFEKAQKNIFFYGNYIGLELEQYEEVVESIINKPNLIYGNMIRDLYFLGKVLDKKFNLLQYSYNIFIVGLIITVISFLIAVHTL